MTTFAVTDQGQVIDALNYVLSNLGSSTAAGGGTDANAVTINTQTGVIGQGGIVLSYLYQYITVRYATSASGAGLTTNPIGATFFGVYNNNSTTPPDINNPSNYQFTQTAAPLSSTNQLYFSTLGGRQIQFFVGTSAAVPQPSTSWSLVGATAIDLDFVTATDTFPIVIATAFLTSNTVPGTPTGGTYNFGNLQFVPPAGWSNSVPANTTSYFSSQNQFQSDGITSIAAPGLPWTTPVLTGRIGTDGANGTPGANGVNGANGANGVSTYFYNVFLSSANAPATPTGGFYNFATSTGTPPAGWNNTAVSVGGNPIWAVSATVSSTNPTANVSIGSSWSSTFQYTGAGGAPGQRGFVPMAYVLTPSTPVGASTAALSQWFQAATNGTPPGSNTAPVGTGFVPVTGDTAAFTFSGNTAIMVVNTYNASTNTWTPANGQVINGNVFVTGSVNAAKLNANDVYSITTRSTNANLGNNSSFGYWFDSTTGNARIAGNVSIGNTATIGANLIVGANASIGTNLTVGNNLTIGNNANIGNNLTIGSNLTLGANISIGNNALIGNNAAIGNNVVIGNNAFIGGNLTVAGLITGNGISASLNANTVQTTTVVEGAVSGGSIGFSSSTGVTVKSAPVSGTLYPTDVVTTITTTQANQSVYINGFIQNVFFGTTGAQTGVAVASVRLSRFTSANVQTNIAELQTVMTYEPNQSNLGKIVQTPFIGFIDTLPTVGTYTYRLLVGYSTTSGLGTLNLFLIEAYERTLSTQTLKR